MKVKILLIAGSRTVSEEDAFTIIEEEALRRGWNKETISLVLSGHARGPDRAGERWAAKEGIPIKCFIPKWERYGRVAGMIRNQEMATQADLSLVVWDHKSSGSKNTIDTMTAMEKEVVVVIKEQKQ